MLIFQGFANSRIVREFPPFSFKVRIATLTRNPPQLRLFRPPVSLCFQGFSRVLKTKYFAVLTRRSNILVFPLF